MKRSGLAVLLGVVAGLVSCLVAGPAFAEIDGYLCHHSGGGAATWHFGLDEERQSVAIDAPVNWTWMTRDSVLFLHYATIDGRQYATQTYTLDRRSGRFEVCDFTAGNDQPVACDARWRCAPAAPPALPVALSARRPGLHPSSGDGWLPDGWPPGGWP